MIETVEIHQIKEQLGTLARTLRKRKQLTQVEMADRLDVSRNTIQNLEAGKNYTIDTLMKVLKELDLTTQLYQELKSFETTLTETKPLY